MISRGTVRNLAAKFCSRECNFAFQRARNIKNGTGRLTKPCEVCGEPFTFYRSVRPTAAYCSGACRSVGHARKMTGRIRDTYGRSATFRKAIRVKFIDCCAICGWTEAPNDVCHIVPRKDGGADAMDNVVMLCPNHHRLFDRGVIPVAEVRAARAAILRC